MKSMSDHEFGRYRKLIYSRAGIHLTPPKKALLEARLNRRLRELGLESFREYFDYITADQSGAELVRLLDRVATNETHFFREPRQFEFLENTLLPDWLAQSDAGLRPRQVRVWSAGCSTGEEPYSLAMTLLDHLPPARGWRLEIVGSDLSTRVVEAAQKAIWPIAKAEEIPERYLKRFMLKGSGAQAAYMKAGPELRSIVRCLNLNLNAQSYPLSGRFDLIFCRNVMIYFDAPTRARVVERLLRHLTPGGYLLVGHAESLTGVSSQLRHVIPTVYTTQIPASSASATGSAHAAYAGANR